MLGGFRFLGWSLGFSFKYIRGIGRSGGGGVWGVVFLVGLVYVFFLILVITVRCLGDKFFFERFCLVGM